MNVPIRRKHFSWTRVAQPPSGCIVIFRYTTVLSASFSQWASLNFAVYGLATLFIKDTGMARLTRWGNSEGGLRLPKAIVEAAGLRVGDEVSCRLLDSGAILLTPSRLQHAAATTTHAEEVLGQSKSEW